MSFTSNRVIRLLAAIGAAFLLFTTVSLCKLLLAFHHNSNYASAFAAAPPRDAFDGKVFWITGASSGIGRQMVRHLCSSHDNVKLILSSRRKAVLEEVAAECTNMGMGAEAKVLALDLSDIASLPSKAKKALSLYGGNGVDILFNNGGVSTRSMARNSGFDVDTFVTHVDFLSYVALTKALLPSWETNDNKEKNNSRPSIINTSSVTGKVGVPVRTSYSAAKHAIHGWFNAFRIEQEIVGHPVNVLNVVLGSTRTSLAHNAIVESSNQKFGQSDGNIESGLDPTFIVERVLASAHAGHNEMWIAPKKEMLILYLNQYIPETAYKIMSGTVAKQYAVQKEITPSPKGDGEGGEL